MGILTKREGNRYPATREPKTRILSLRDEMDRLFDDLSARFGGSLWPTTGTAAVPE